MNPDEAKLVALRILQENLPSSVSVDENALTKASFDGLKVAFTPSAVITAKRSTQIGEGIGIGE